MADTVYNKDALVADLAEQKNVSKAEAARWVASLIDLIEGELVKGNTVKVSGLFTASVVDKPARTGRHPQTGDPIDIPARKAPVFKATANIKKAVNES